MGTSLPPNSLAVLFRNNHFLTLYKYNYDNEPVSVAKRLSHFIGFEDNIPPEFELVTLVTDEGYLQNDRIVWETLGNMEGDSVFLDAIFRLHTSSKHDLSGLVSPPPSVVPPQEDADLAYALTLQEEEEQRRRQLEQEQLEQEQLEQEQLHREQLQREQLQREQIQDQKEEGKCIIN